MIRDLQRALTAAKFARPKVVKQIRPITQEQYEAGVYFEEGSDLQVDIVPSSDKDASAGG